MQLIFIVDTRLELEPLQPLPFVCKMSHFLAGSFILVKLAAMSFEQKVDAILYDLGAGTEHFIRAI